METPNHSNYELKAGDTVYIPAPGDDPTVVLPGEPFPRPFVVVTMPYAKWLILSSSAERVADAEAELAAMTESSQRNAELADSFEKQLNAERAKNAPNT